MNRDLELLENIIFELEEIKYEIIHGELIEDDNVILEKGNIGKVLAGIAKKDDEDVDYDEGDAPLPTEPQSRSSRVFGFISSLYKDIKDLGVDDPNLKRSITEALSSALAGLLNAKREVMESMDVMAAIVNGVHAEIVAKAQKEGKKRNPRMIKKAKKVWNDMQKTVQDINDLVEDTNKINIKLN